MNPLFGLLAGSVTMSGGHGTGAAYAKLFGEVNNLQGADGGGDGLRHLRPGHGRHHRRAGGRAADQPARAARHARLAPTIPEPTAPGELGPDERRPLSPESFFETVLLILFCVGVGSLIAGVVHDPLVHAADLRLVPADRHRRLQRVQPDRHLPDRHRDAGAARHGLPVPVPGHGADGAQALGAGRAGAAGAGASWSCRPC